MHASGSTPDFASLPRPQTPALVRFYSEPKRAVQNSDTDTPLFAGRSEPAAPTEVSFGPFRLLLTQFLLLEGDKPVPLGSRALEILIVLLERAGEVVSKEELMARVWPNIFVEPANVTVHISGLRRTLRDGQDGNRFIINIPGRGYKFVASVAAARHHAARYHKAPLAIVSGATPQPEGRPQTQTSSDGGARNIRAVHSSRASTL